MKLQQEDLVTLALEVTGMSRQRWDSLLEEMKSDAQMNLRMRSDWNEKARDTEGSIREYYKASDIWFVNTFQHGVGALLGMANGESGPRAGWSQKFTEMVSPLGGKILDYGGGFFKDTWPLVSMGYQVDVAEIRGPVTEFLKRFIKLAGLDGKAGVVEVDSETPIGEMYQGIACFETLEHLLYPTAMAAHLHAHLLPGGPFAFSVTFGAPEHAPYHVASNAHLSDWKVWASILEKIGFSPCWEDPGGSSAKIWRSLR